MWTEFFRYEDYVAIKPEIVLSIFAIGILITDFMLEKRDKYLNAVTALVGLGLAGTAVVLDWYRRGGFPYHGFGGAIVNDDFFTFFSLIFIASTALVVLISIRYLEIEGAHYGEYYALLLFSVVGMMFLACGTDLIVLFMALELMAVSGYILAGFLRQERRSNEAALKYFLLGAFSSGILLYGMSLLFGLSGSTQISVIAQRLAEPSANGPITWLAMITVAVGLFFKVAAAPFHQWTPDAYEGAPTTVTAFMSVAPKAGAFALLLRMFLDCIWPLRADWQIFVIAVAVITMTVGNLAALTQDNIKRLLAYSTIAHVGYILLGLVAAADGSSTGLQGMAIYLLVYAFTTLGAFSVIVALRRKNCIGDQVDDMSGLYEKAPGSAFLMLIFLLSLAGIPPTAGFIGKYFIFLALIETGHYTLAVLAVLYVVVAIFYYFRIVVAMFMKPAPDAERLSFSPGILVTLAVTLVLTLGIGILPNWFILKAEQAVRPFLQ
ncbi:MAG: NADH-quinone oxidoreductase subunit N [Acidobacteriota bacterium]